MPARVSLATFEWRRGRSEKAEAQLKEALALEPKNAEVNRSLASVYLATNRTPLAEAPLKTLAEALQPIQQKKALIYFSSGMERSGTDNQVELRAAVNADSGIFLRKPQLQCLDYLVAGPYKELKKYKPQD